MAWSLIAHSSGANAATTAINTTGADLIILVTVTFGSQTPTDSASNTWTGLTERVGSGGNQPRTKIWYCSNPTTSATHTFNTSSFYSLEVQAWSGSLTSASPFDVENGAGSGAVSSLATGSITPSQDNELVVSGFGVDTSTSGHTWSVTDSNFTPTISDQVASNSNGTNFGSGMSYVTQTTATAMNETWSISGGTTTSGLSAAIAAFKAAAGGGGSTNASTVGSVAGVATLSGVSNIVWNTAGNSAGLGTALGVSGSTQQVQTVGVSTGLGTAVGAGNTVTNSVGNSAGVGSGAAVGLAIQPGQATGVSSGIATVSGVANTLAYSTGSSAGISDAAGVNPQVVVNQIGVITSAGGELTWRDHVKAVHEMRMLEGRIREQKKELQKVVKKLKTVEKKVKSEKNKGILANLVSLEFKKDEIENKIQALEVDLAPLIMFLEKWEIEEDDNEFMSLQ